MGSKGNKKVFLFSFVNELTWEGKSRLDKGIKKLGGISKLNEDMYVSDATHILVPDKVDQKWCPKIFGALASGKFVVNTSYIEKSLEAGKFLDEVKFRPVFVDHIVEHVKRYV